MWPHGAGCVWIAWAGVGGRLVESGMCSSDMLKLSDPSGAHVDHRCRGILAPSLARARCPWLVLCSQRWLEAACLGWLTAGNLILEASAYAWGISTHGLMSWRGACWCFQQRNPSEAFGVGDPGPLAEWGDLTPHGADLGAGRLSVSSLGPEEEESVVVPHPPGWALCLTVEADCALPLCA